ncbi:osteopetrosis-associated transmembrane protein 1-like isoform X2 [Littorina saxatilis]|uniref:Osteopetrosis-associated transmembrane protein 1 n=2 Tax=Littorina saxatilis TaxID=31220 RepID=A0AAN9BMR4_9CAEN
MIARVFIFAVAIVAAISEDEIKAKQQSSVAETSRPSYEQKMEILLDGALSHWYNLPGNNTPMSNVTDPCDSILHHFALAGGNFTKCLLDHARPFRMCEKCVTDYTRFVHLYDDLQGDERCSHVLLLADRVQVVTSTYRNFKTTWASAFCDKCYDFIDVNSTSGKVSFNFTADVRMLQEMQTNVTDCFLDNAKCFIPANDTGKNISSVCTVCRSVYQEMNKKYVELKTKNGGHMCMDLVDMMNYTRLMWSNRFQCSRPMPSSVSVIIICVVACLAVFSFYASMPFLANIRKPNIFKAKRIDAAHSHYGAIREDIADRSLPEIARSSNESMDARRRMNSQQPMDGNGVSSPRAITGTR